ncbi:MAG: acyl-CoA dehydrogenase family protein, partial [Chitinophagales bacterium]|nr:acyl-CoA dehydrogenase family protein [Chitinophagales bacterium]
TERTGGSDVSRSMTFAEKNGNEYLLYGHKWFTSAITADMAFTLATTEKSNDAKPAALSLFFLQIKNNDGTLNGIEVEALKDKLGTRALPTAQLQLNGVKATLVGEQNKGVRTISTLFNITRIYNTISAVSYMRRAYSLSEKYGKKREVFGQMLQHHVLHKKTIRNLEIAYQSNTLLGLFLARLLGKEECLLANEQEQSLLRVLTPIAKLYTAKQSIKSASEHIEVFGGIGYLEDSGIPSMLRDTQVLSIWEGTTNVLSLDMLRAFEKENGWNAFQQFAKSSLDSNNINELQTPCDILQNKINILNDFIQSLDKKSLMACAKDIAFYIAEATIALLWLDFLNTNYQKENYLNTFNFWLQYKMSEQDLHSSKALNLL